MIKTALTCSALLGLLLIVSPTPAEAGGNRAVRGRAVPPALAPNSARSRLGSNRSVGHRTLGRGGAANGRVPTQNLNRQSLTRQNLGQQNLAGQRRLGASPTSARNLNRTVRAPQSLQPGQFGYRGGRTSGRARAGLSSLQGSASNLRGQWNGSSFGRRGTSPLGRTAGSPARDTRINRGLLGVGNAAHRSNLTGGVRQGLSSLGGNRANRVPGAVGRASNLPGRTTGSNRGLGRNQGFGNNRGLGSNRSGGANALPALPTPIVGNTAGRGAGRGSLGSGRSRVGTARGNHQGRGGRFGFGRNRGIPSSLGAQSPALRTGRGSYTHRRGHARHAHRHGRWRSLWRSHYYYPTYPTHVIEYVPAPQPYVAPAPYVEPYVEYEPYVAPVPHVPNEHIGQTLPAPQSQQVDAFEQGAIAFEARQYTTAHEWFDKAVRADPQDGEAWLGLMHTSLMLDRYQDAAAAITRVGELGGIGPGYDLNPRDVYGDDPVAYDAAVVRLESFAARYPRDPDALLVVAFIRVARGDHALARNDLRRLRSLDRGSQMATLLERAMQPAPTGIQQR